MAWPFLRRVSTSGHRIGVRALSFDVAVIGGGVLGLSHAAAASAAGLRCIVIERSPHGAEAASVRNFGLLTELYNDGGLWGARARRSRALYSAWAAEEPSLPLSVVGSLQLAQTPLQAALLRAFAAAAPAAGYSDARLVERAEAQRLAPALPPDAAVECGVHFPSDALLEPRLMFRRGLGLPRLLERRGVAFAWGSPCVALSRGASGGVALALADGRAISASRALLCAGADVGALLPRALLWEAPRMRLCKLQMLRVRVAALGSASGVGGGLRGGVAGGARVPAHPVLTSGLSLRRYPGPASLCPAEHAAMMAGDAAASAAAEALGVHIIARPAPALPRSPFGALVPQADGVALSGDEFVVGDSHEYRAVAANGDSSAAAAALMDEACDEGITDAILKQAAGMLRGVDGLLAARGSISSGSSDERGASFCPPARLVSQW